jgi:hypothetical protein
MSSGDSHRRNSASAMSCRQDFMVVVQVLVCLVVSSIQIRNIDVNQGASLGHWDEVSCRVMSELEGPLS